MCVEIPDVRIGEPQVCGGVTVFPLFAERSSSLDYLLADEAMAAGTLVVREVSEEGSVGDLLAENGGDQPVLFVEGEEVRGGKQNRALCNSILAAGTSRTKIPVACTEPGRWNYESRQFTGNSCCPPSLRHVLKDGGNGCQLRVWATIRRQHRRLGIRSRTESMSDAVDARQEAAEGLRRGLRCPEGASGIAVALGGKVAVIDIFDQPATMAKLWDRLVQGLVLDVATTGDTACRAIESDAAVKLYGIRSLKWQQVEPVVGLGESYRGRSENVLATALVAGDTLVHLGASMSVVP
jgi:hypothetical protein